MGSVSFAEDQSDPSNNGKASSTFQNILLLWTCRLHHHTRSTFSFLLFRAPPQIKTQVSDSQGEKLHLFLAPCPAMSDNSLFIPRPLDDIEAYQQWQKYIE